MSTAYDDFFKKAKEQKSDKPAPQPIQVKRRHRQKSSHPPFKIIAAMALGLLIALGGLVFVDDFDAFVSKIHIGAFSSARAADGDGAEKAAETEAEASAKVAAAAAQEAENKKKSIKYWSDKDLSFLNKLSDRKTELDRREKELEEVERELQSQKKVLDRKIANLKSIRGEISKILKERIEMDDEKVGKLVDFYSNMKPVQAAQVFAEINEDLAVEVLGRMKKKDAAAILNLLKPDKAQVLSEKFAGYRKLAQE